MVDLPEELLRQILGYLLHTDKIDLTRSQGSETSKYHFEVAILRTCHVLHRLGLSIFCRNHFVLLSTRPKTLIDRFERNPQISLWKTASKLKKFKRYHLRLHIGSETASRETKETTFGLFCVADIEAVVLELRVLICWQRCISRFTFKLLFELEGLADGSGDLPPKVQHALLRPFVKSRSHNSIFMFRSDTKASDDVLRLMDSMRSPIFWARANVSDSWELITYMRRLADDALSRNDYICATSRYTEAMSFAHDVVSVHREWARMSDDAFEDACTKMMIVIHYNSTLARLSLFMSNPQKHASILEDILDPPGAEEATFRPAIRAGLAQIRGFGFIVKGQRVQAIHYFKLAVRLDATNEDAGTVLTNLEKACSPKNGKKLALQLFKSHGPKAWTKPIIIKSCISATLDQELYDLKVLGYTGSVATHLVQKDGYSAPNGIEIAQPFDKNVRDRALKELLAHVKLCSSIPRTPPAIEVGQVLCTADIAMDSQELGAMKQGFRLLGCNNAEDIPRGTTATESYTYERPVGRRVVAKQIIKRWDPLDLQPVDE